MMALQSLTNEELNWFMFSPLHLLLRKLEFTSRTGGHGSTYGFTARCKGREGTPECLQLTKLVAGTDIEYPICVGLTTPLV